METPHTFAGRVIKRGGKQTQNDFSQPEKFFADVRSFFSILDGVPLSAVEDLEKYELNRELIVNTIRQCLKILDKAGINIIDEIHRIDADPFDGIEEDLAMKKRNIQIKISAESEK